MSADKRVYCNDCGFSCDLWGGAGPQVIEEHFKICAAKRYKIAYAHLLNATRDACDFLRLGGQDTMIDVALKLEAEIIKAQLMLGVEKPTERIGSHTMTSRFPYQP